MCYHHQNRFCTFSVYSHRGNLAVRYLLFHRHTFTSELIRPVQWHQKMIFMHTSPSSTVQLAINLKFSLDCIAHGSQTTVRLIGLHVRLLPALL